MSGARAKKLLIGIVGPTGAGKTTLADGLGKLLDYRVHREMPRENEYWHDFYSDLNSGVRPSHHSLGSQLSFLTAAVEQARDGLENRESGVVWDVTPVGHRMYADLQHEQGLMSDRSYRLYQRLFEVLAAGLPQPDVLLVVTVDQVEVLVERIKRRGRNEEMETPASYWKKQISYWRKKLAVDGKNMLALDSGKIDWRSEPGVKEVWRLVEEMFDDRGIK